jgi:hypothetical protein
MKKPSHIKHYLKSKTAEGLKVLMTNNNVKRMHYFDYDIIHDGSNWFAWYEWDIDGQLSGVMDETDNQGQGAREV